MIVELHLLQNFAPSNLNRDDTGAPKDCEFGGVRRARISSQCLKRAVRRGADFSTFLGDRAGIRTRRLIVEIAESIAGQSPPPEKVVKVVSEVFREGGIERPKGRGENDPEKDTTSLILYLDQRAIGEMTSRFQEQWEGLTTGDKSAKEATRLALGTILTDAVKVPDIALFGRMIELPAATPFGKLQLGIDGSCQVAHAISTHAVNMEFDFYTAVDDIPGPDAGASMMGTIEFNSACFYRYANIDLRQLTKNLGGDVELARQTVRAFLQASITAIPTGKQNSMAAQNPPSFIFAVARERGLWSLANAFAKPIAAPRGTRRDEHDLVRESVRALDGYWRQLTTVYGDGGFLASAAVALDPSPLDALAPAQVGSVGELLGRIDAAIGADQAA